MSDAEGQRPSDQERRASLYRQVWRIDPTAPLDAEDEAALLGFLAKEEEFERRDRYVDEAQHRTRVTVRSRY